MSFDFKTIIISLIALGIVIFLLRLFRAPLKWLLRLVFSSILGGAALFVLSIAFAKFGLHLAVNPLNALTVGVLGIPGIVVVIALTMML